MAVEGNYLIFDCETGGLNPQIHSLLTAHFIVANKNFEIISELSLAMKPEHSAYTINPSAMCVNKIDLMKHDKVAIKYDNAKQQLHKFIRDNSDKGRSKLLPIGHNIKFDIDMVNHYLLRKSCWEQFVSYRVLDTASIARYLIELGYLPKNCTSLDKISNHLCIIVPGEPHEAKHDTLKTFEVYRRLLEIVPKFKIAP